jgi:signal peptide peptidase SppA
VNGSPLPTYETLLVAPRHVGAVRAVLARAPGIIAEARAPLAGPLATPKGAPPPRYRLAGETVVVPVVGALVEFGDVGLTRYGLTSYSWIAATVTAAAADPAVKRIVLQVDSPGGRVNGITSAHAAILAARQAKPVLAVVTGLAASAGYWLASAADAVAVDEMGMVGGIGAVVIHTDVSGALEKAGIKATVIYAGAHKMDGNAFEALPEAVRADIQSEVENLRIGFAQAIAQGRPKLTVALALATEARVYPARDFRTGLSPAIGARLADRLGTLASVLAEPVNSSPKPQTDRRSPAMTVFLPVPPAFAGSEAAFAAGVEAGRADASARIRAILSAPEARGREQQAATVAFTTDMPPAAAAQLLAAMPKATVPVAKAADTIAAQVAATGANDVGGPPPAGATFGGGAKAGWKAVADAMNARAGA